MGDEEDSMNKLTWKKHPDPMMYEAYVAQVSDDDSFGLRAFEISRRGTNGPWSVGIITRDLTVDYLVTMANGLKNKAVAKACAQAIYDATTGESDPALEGTDATAGESDPAFEGDDALDVGDTVVYAPSLGTVLAFTSTGAPIVEYACAPGEVEVEKNLTQIVRVDAATPLG